MDRPEILHNIKDQISELSTSYCIFSYDEIEEDDSFIDIGMDSLHDVELVMALEDVFGIELVDEEVEELKTVAELVELFYIKLNVPN